VTGFSLYTLCHFFGRRGRAMASSLARQEGCDIPLQLTVFYSRPEDARHVLEGVVDGPHPPRVTFEYVAPGDALKKAQHYSKAQDMHALSHTVFVDADLWFPPHFWKEYAAVLNRHEPGYWSCRVMNVPFQTAEDLVVDWTHLSAERLALHASGERYGYANGSVGHFQCIPRILEVYADDGVAAVNRTDTRFSAGAIARSGDPRVERRIGSAVAYHLDHPWCWTGTGGAEY
jgi:hypothetical protein